jgi:hypothetical protein
MDYVKLNKKQKEYLNHVLSVDRTIVCFNDVKQNYAIGCALMMLDSRGYLIDDYTSAVRDEIYDLRKKYPSIFDEKNRVFIAVLKLYGLSINVFSTQYGYHAEIDEVMILSGYQTLDDLSDNVNKMLFKKNKGGRL